MKNWILVGCVVACLTSAAYAEQPTLGKKGLGLVESAGYGEPQLQAVQAAWYYNWGASSQVKTARQFVPMAFSLRFLKTPSQEPLLLGFNEPDNARQSDISVQVALTQWPFMASKTKRIGSPAMAGNPVTGDWLPLFMKQQPKVDFVTLHWYKGVSASKFIKDVQALCTAYQKPVWVTEFAPQTASQSQESPDKYSQAQVNQFIQETVHWMNASDCVERFAWHDAKVGTSALFDAKGRLTLTGKAYAEAY